VLCEQICASRDKPMARPIGAKRRHGDAAKRPMAPAKARVSCDFRLMRLSSRIHAAFRKIPGRSGEISGLTIVLAGVAAGILATLVQLLLWLAFTGDFPALLFRDVRLTAALLLGSSILPPPATFDMTAMLVATLIHFVLSIAYAAMLTALTVRLGTMAALMAGVGFGLALYVVNLYGFTLVFPWFAQARGWIAVIAHIVFGLSAVLAYRSLHRQ
jgi:hypothetical protein